MSIATIAVDLAKNVFELAATDETGKIVERRRLNRSQFDRYFENRECIRPRYGVEELWLSSWAPLCRTLFLGLLCHMLILRSRSEDEVLDQPRIEDVPGQPVALGPYPISITL